MKRRDFLQSVKHTGIAASAFAVSMGHTSESLGRTRLSLYSSQGNLPGDRYVNPRKVLLWESTRREIRESLAAGKLEAAIIPTGSTEQHNEHLAMIQDTASALLIAQETALKLYPKVIVATPVSIGISPHWMNRKGTLSLRREIFLGIVYDICESLKTHGIRTVLIVNGHGGNVDPLKEAMPEFRAKLGITLDSCSYWDAYTTEHIENYIESGKVPDHGSEFETSFALAAFPERVHHEGVEYDKAKLTINEEEKKSDKLRYEESLLATAEKGEVMIAIAVQWVTDKLRNMMG